MDITMRSRRGNTCFTGGIDEDLSSWVGSRLDCCTGGSAGIIAPRALWSETRLQRHRTYQAVGARGIGRVITACAMTPQTRGRHVGTNQSVMTRGIAGIITACPKPAAAEYRAERALLSSTWDSVYDE